MFLWSCRIIKHWVSFLSFLLCPALSTLQLALGSETHLTIQDLDHPLPCFSLGKGWKEGCLKLWALSQKWSNGPVHKTTDSPDPNYLWTLVTPLLQDCTTSHFGCSSKGISVLTVHTFQPSPITLTRHSAKPIRSQWQSCFEVESQFLACR